MIEKTVPIRKNKTEKVHMIVNGTCNRCLGNSIGYDSKNRAYCLECFTYGSLSEERYLYRYEREIPKVKHIMDMEYNLSDLQKQGSEFLLESYRIKRTGFLQAVCGAGKTEMTYDLILKALNDNLRICFVIPRVQVLKQVYKRLFRHFPKTNVKPLYADFKDAKHANLIVSTPQQMILFYKEFDLIIVDEVDAFPLKDNEFLDRLIQKSKKNSGIILYMSATISASFKKLIDAGQIRYFLIPERYHKKDLPVPEFIKCLAPKRNLFVHKFLEKHLTDQRQFLMFVPSVKKAESYYEYYKANYRCGYITSTTKYKSDIIRSFQSGEYLFLIATTILERGVTFPNIDVIVFEADNEVFTKETLIQMSGRVGRNADSPTGEIKFLSRYLTKAMTDARKEIITMNEAKHEM